MDSGNLLAQLPEDRSQEHFEALLARPGLRLERIVSHGQATPDGVWYDQATEEWVLLIAGAAALRIEGEAEARRLQVGDWIRLPAHCRHRVEWTAADCETVWLALHYP